MALYIVKPIRLYYTADNLFYYESFFRYYWKLSVYMVKKRSIIYRLLIGHFHINCRGLSSWMIQHWRESITDPVIINVLYRFPHSIDHWITVEKNCYWSIFYKSDKSKKGFNIIKKNIKFISLGHMAFERHVKIKIKKGRLKW